MKLLRNISFPFVPLYYFGTWFRSLLYDLDIKKSKSYDFPLICVGNLSVGGTGKTPMIEYLIRLLKDNYNIATLSRGYKRKTKGFILANEQSSAITIGDEPYQFYSKFKKDISVAVDANRQHGIETLRQHKDSVDLILLDDAFQHRKVKAGLNILLTTYNDLYIKDILLPTGNLREPKSGAKRADIIVVTKCPNELSEAKMEKIIKQLKLKPNQSIFFSSIKYANEVVSETKTIRINDLKEFNLVTGIANANPLVNFLKSKTLQFKHLNFKDHHEFSEKDIMRLGESDIIVTTEKDYMRLKQHPSLKAKLFYLPIEIIISQNEKFNKYIQNFVNIYADAESTLDSSPINSL